MKRVSPYINPIDDSCLSWIRQWERQTGLKWGETIEREEETENYEEYEETKLENETDKESM